MKCEECKYFDKTERICYYMGENRCVDNEDAINRQAVLEIINDIRDCISVEGYWAIFERMKKLPPVTPQPKTGHWIYTGYVCQTDEIIYGYGCSKCGAISFFRKSDNKILGGKWCHYCGAGMVEPQAESKEVWTYKT